MQVFYGMNGFKGIKRCTGCMACGSCVRQSLALLGAALERVHEVEGAQVVAQQDAQLHGQDAAGHTSTSTSLSRNTLQSQPGCGIECCCVSASAPAGLCSVDQHVRGATGTWHSYHSTARMKSSCKKVLRCTVAVIMFQD